MLPPSPFTVALAPLPEPASRILLKDLKLLQDALAAFQDPCTFEIATLDGPLPEDEPSHELARAYLNQFGASILLWPQLLEDEQGQNLALVSITGALEHPCPPRFRLEICLPLPEHQAHGFCMMILLAVALEAIAFESRWASPLAAPLMPLLLKADVFLRSSQAQEAFLSQEQRGLSHLLLANAQAFFGLEYDALPLLEQAVGNFKRAGDDLTREHFPLLWARARVGRAQALSRLSKEDPDASKLWVARAFVLDALEELRPETLPSEWAGAHCDLGITLTRLGDRYREPTHFEEAVRAFRQSLLEWTREQEPVLWATTLAHLGYALMRLGELEDNEKYLEEAVKVFEFSLLERGRMDLPLAFRQSQSNLHHALECLAKLRRDSAIPSA